MHRVNPSVYGCPWWRIRDCSGHRWLRPHVSVGLVFLAICTGSIYGCQPEAKWHKGVEFTAEPLSGITLIVHADDAGLCHSVNAATVAAMENGTVTSASILVAAPGFEEFAVYARQHPEGDFGVHLALNAEWDNPRWGPIAGRDRVPSLVDPAGHLWRSPRDTLRNATIRDVEIELRAQVDLAKRSGIPVSHLDTHMLVLLSRADLIDVFARLGAQYKVPIAITRLPEGMARHISADLWPAYQAAVRQLENAGLPVIDFIDHGSYNIDPEGKPEYYLSVFRSLLQGTSQIVIHCGYADSELSAITDSAQKREADYTFFTSVSCRHAIDDLKIRLIGWQDLVTTTRH